MENWHEVGRENRRAASILFRESIYRAMIGRAYYATYAEVTHVLTGLSINMPQGRESPLHRKLRNLIEANLTTMPPEQRRALSRTVSELYDMRLHADYIASVPINEKMGRKALQLMQTALDLLQEYKHDYGK
jgi:uncharacterized protein (UPF0332 family)